MMTDTSSVQPSVAGADAVSGETTQAQTSRVMLEMPVNVRSVSLVVIATLAGVFMLHWASAVFIPVLVGLLSSYPLSPVFAGWNCAGFHAY